MHGLCVAYAQLILFLDQIAIRVDEINRSSAGHPAERSRGSMVMAVSDTSIGYRWSLKCGFRSVWLCSHSGPKVFSTCLCFLPPVPANISAPLSTSKLKLFIFTHSHFLLHLTIQYDFSRIKRHNYITEFGISKTLPALTYLFFFSFSSFIRIC
jgi:hypothetical protein